MAKHEFGGDWTTDKLERVRKYLHEYMKIFSRNPRAQYFTTTYVDAFAGTGSRTDSASRGTELELFAPEADLEAEEYKKGSARIALEVQPPFGRYVFIERDADRVGDLRQLVAQFAATQDAVKIVQGEANDFLRR